jgi:hypothetical protein
MKSLPFAGFQVGIVDDPFNDTNGGFEFASGMDIFSEPGVLKACNALAEVSYGTGATPTATPLWMVDTIDSLGATHAYIATGTKLLESTDGSTFNLFLTNSKGVNKGLGVFGDFVYYAADGYIGLVQIGVGGGAIDNYYTYGTYTASDYYPIIQQGGTLKIAAGRYITSVDESLTFTPQAFKLPTNNLILCLTDHFDNIYIGGKWGYAGGSTAYDSSVFTWRGTVLSSGSALPDTVYKMKLQGMNALLSDGRILYAFPDSTGEILTFDSVGFPIARKLFYVANKGSLTVRPGAVSQYKDSILFAGDTNVVPGVFQMQGGVICQSFVPSGATPGVDSSITIGFIKVAFDGSVYIGYKKASDSSYHIEKTTTNRQNGAVVRTVWHHAGGIKNRYVDHLKRWCGVKFNLKPMASGCSIKVEYRTDTNASFTDSGVTVDSSNQEKPAIFPAQPRSRSIQFRFTYTTSGSNTPEMFSYDVLFEVLSRIIT